MNLFIAGVTGLLGQALVRHWSKQSDVQILGIGRRELSAVEGLFRSTQNLQYIDHDLSATDNSFLEHLNEFKPNLIINCIGLVDLQLCEENPQLAELINVNPAIHLAKYASNHKIQLIHISTDQVFDGHKLNDYSEEDKVSPINVYGRTKLKAEQFVNNICPNALITRTNIVGFRGLSNRPTFVEWLCESLKTKANVTLFDDFLTSSIHVDDLADLLDVAYKKEIAGLYNIATRDTVSKYEFGKRLAKGLRLSSEQITRGSMSKAMLTPPRPLNIGLSVVSVEQALCRPLPTTAQTIDKIVRDYHLRDSF